MRCPSVRADEPERLAALAEYDLENGHSLPTLEPVVNIAARMFDMPVAAVNMIGDDHVFFAASVGIRECDMRRDVSFCAHAINQDDVMVVLDATQDERFHDNPLVTGESGIRFYAGVPLHSPSGHALGALCVIDSEPRTSFSRQDRERLKDLARMASDKLELRRLERNLDERAARFENIAADSPSPILCFDARQNIIFWNHAAQALFGYRSDEIVGQPLDTILPVLEDHPLSSVIQGMLRSGDAAITAIRETSGLHKSGARLPVELSFFRWNHAGERLFGATLTDITERRRQRVELHRMANFDDLTGLANRSLFCRRVVDELIHSTTTGILAVDLDGFKDINNTLGQSVGDHLLTVVADRIRRAIRPSDTVARLGSDEFGVLLPGLGDSASCTSVAQTIASAIRQPLPVDHHEIRLSSSCGIALAPTHGSDAEELIGNADLALFQAKGTARGSSVMYVPELREQAEQRRQYDAELHRAVEKEEFELFYQPQVRLRDNRIVGAEALIRWKHPQRGYLSPALFLPSLISGSLAPAVGAWTIEQACAQTARWMRSGVSLRMGINLFAAQFAIPGFAIGILESLHRYRLDPTCIELEITENIILDRDELIITPLRILRDAGLGIAFDDFGTGYASLSMLKNYPLTRIKIDRSFISSMCTSRQDEATVAATLSLARIYELEAIAEGVETDAQLEALRKLGCDEVQGYFTGRPMPAAQFSAALAENYKDVVAADLLSEVA